MGSIREDLERIRLLERRGIDNARRELALRRAWENRGRENEKDRELYEEFRRIAEAGKEENGNRFRLSYVYSLPVSWNILILLGKKNIGKTYNINRLISECLDTNREIILVRVTARETLTALAPFLEEEGSRVKIRNKGAGYFEIVEKPTDFEDIKQRNNPKRVGFCASISTLTSYQGASYSRVKYIVWDECITDGVRQIITMDQIRAFERFISSIVRDKTDVKVLIFGNLLARSEDHRGDPLLSYYGIDPSCGCKYIPAKSAKNAGILFLNTREMFKGIESQGVLGGVSPDSEESLLTNSVDTNGIKTLDPATYYKAAPAFSLVFTYNLTTYAIHIRNIHEEGFSPFLIVMANTFKVGDIAGNDSRNRRAYTNEEALANTYSHCVEYLNRKEWAEVLGEVCEYFSKKKVLYADQETAWLVTKFVKHLRNETDDVGVFGKKFI